MEQEDEDTSNDVVRQPDVLTEVKLCSTICKFPFYYAYVWHLTSHDFFLKNDAGP